jgi:hypothetical protein
VPQQVWLALTVFQQLSTNLQRVRVLWDLAGCQQDAAVQTARAHGFDAEAVMW